MRSAVLPGKDLLMSASDTCLEFISEFGLKMAEIRNMMFNILVNEMTVDSETDIIKERDETSHLWFRDYVIVMKGQKKEGQRDILISLQSSHEFIYGLVKGFEVFKLSNPDNSLASPNPLPQARDLPYWTIQNLLSVFGCRNAIATIAVTVLILINVIVHEVQKFREANPVEEVNKPSLRAKRHCLRFSLAEIQSTTRNFSNALLIGKGGFGSVYKGLIDKGRETVAIKRSKSSSGEGPHEFWTEIETLSKVRHMNLVSLIGYCNEGNEMILVYEYMTKGTLADHLFKRVSGENSLTWKQRLNICIGAGRGLDYLHTGQRIIHRDVKSSNILLDENFISKVSDFGLAKTEDRSNTQSHINTNVKGTPGYVDPYYYKTLKLTRKSDTYAFGVVLLEVLCGRPAVVRRVGEDVCFLTQWARNKIKMGEVDQIIDSSLTEEIPPASLKVFLEIAERCLHDEPKERPTMAQVVLQLEFALKHQENSNVTVHNHTSSVADQHETTFPVSNEQPSEGLIRNIHSVEQSNNLSVNNECPAVSKDWRIPKEQVKRELVSPFTWSESRKKQGAEEEEGLTTYEDFDTSGPQYLEIPRGVNLPVSTSTMDPHIESKLETKLFIAYGETSRYQVLDIIGKSTDCVVSSAFDIFTGERVAIKHIHGLFEDFYVAKTVLREIKYMRLLRHPNIVKIKHILLPPSQEDFRDIYIILELMQSDLDQIIKSNSDLNLERCRLLMYQLLHGLTYMHKEGVFHGDLKPKNLLVNADYNLKICNFGLAHIPSKIDYDYGVTSSSLWYRAPEQFGTILTSYDFNDHMDVWSIGCIFAELLTGKPLFPGENEKHQVDLITDLLGTHFKANIFNFNNNKRKKQPVPFEHKFPNVNPLALGLLKRLLAYDTWNRPTPEQALADPYFSEMENMELELSTPSIVDLELEFEFDSSKRNSGIDGIKELRELIYQEILKYQGNIAIWQ